MEKGYVVNNTGRAKHAYKRMVYPGQKVDLSYIYELVKNKIPDGMSLVEWLKKNMLPKGWEVVQETKVEASEYPYKEVLTASRVEVSDTKPKMSQSQKAVKDTNLTKSVEHGEDSPSLEYAPAKQIDKLTYRDIYNLRIKDNPKRIINQIYNVPKLRRALTLCRKDSRKNTLAKIIQHRLKKLGQTLS